MANSHAADSKEENISLSVRQKCVQPVVDDDFPGLFAELYAAASVKSSYDAFVLALHTFMLEVGFIPMDVPESEKKKSLPENWHGSEVYRIKYYHRTCPELCCWMTCIPLGRLVSVFGTVDDVCEFEEVSQCLQLRPYVNDSAGVSDPSKVFSSMKELSQNFKDGFAYPLLANLQDALGFGPTFGLSAAMDHIKMQILSYLPVGSLVAMQSVNKEFSELCNTPVLWKNLYFKDFKNALIDPKQVKESWKELYKRRYVMQRRSLALLPLPPIDFRHRPMPEWDPYPHIRPGLPNNFPGLPEEVRNAFPQLQQRLTPRNVMPNCLFHPNPPLNFSLPHNFF